MERLQKRAEQLGIALSSEQLEQFRLYYEMLIETNKVMNLTAITEFEDVLTKHFLDSIAIVKVIPDIQNMQWKVLDLGTGAGFPGIPLKIAFPQLKITLMDSLNKRIRFLQTVMDTLKLCDIEAVHGRAEEAARKAEYREQYDLCVSRAVANLSTLSEYTLPFVKVGGKFVSYKAAEVEDEVSTAGKAIHVLGGKLTAVNKIVLPDTEIERSFVIIEKKKNTSKVYPRKAGTAGKDPIH